MHFGDIDRIYAGTDSVSKVFLGTDLIWPYTPPTGISGYYYYYQSETGITDEEALEAFETDKVQGPAVSSTTQFTFIAYPKYSGGTGQEVATVICFAIPSSLSIDSVFVTPSGQSKYDITSHFNISTPIIIGTDNYNLFYHRYVIPKTELFEVNVQ